MKQMDKLKHSNDETTQQITENMKRLAVEAKLRYYDSLNEITARQLCDMQIEKDNNFAK